MNLEHIKQKFKSGNEIPVPGAYVTQEEFQFLLSKMRDEQVVSNPGAMIDTVKLAQLLDSVNGDFYLGKEKEEELVQCLRSQLRAPVADTPRVDAILAQWDDDGATRGPAFIELRDLARSLEQRNDAIVAAISAAKESLFSQCCSNPIKNSWGKQVDLTKLNDLFNLASAPVSPQACPTDVCQAGKADGVLCANDECDRANGVRPASAPVAGEAQISEDDALDILSEHGDHNVEHGRIMFDKWTLRAACVDLMRRCRNAASPANNQGWSGWACQYPGKLPRLYGAREIAKLNYDPENGDRMLFLSEYAAPQASTKSSR